MRSLVPFRDINVHASSSHYAFTSPSTPSAQTLVVDRPSGDIRLNDTPLLGAKRVSSIAGILGMIKLRLDKYIIVITKAQPMGRIKGHMVYKVIATEFLPLRERALHDPDEDTYLNLLKTLIKSGPMYFSYSFDITNSFQRQAQSDPSQPLWQRADDRFFWNKFIQSDLIDFANGIGLRNQGAHQQGADPFILPVMFGMMRITLTRIKSTPINFALITRRSRHRVGTRYFTRGIDDQGHVANFNETEQIAILNDGAGGLGGFAGGEEQNGKATEHHDVQVMSYVQTRGSVPVYWAEINTLKYTPSLQVRGVESAVDAAKRHFDEQIKLYGDNYLVNLVNQRGREDKVKKAYEQMVKILVSAPGEATQADYVTDEKIHIVEASQKRQQYDRLHYVYFDFHNETKGLQWHRAQILLNQLLDGLEKGRYFRGVDMPADAQGRMEVRSQQTAVVRTNCMDCLDRTNVVQTMLARWVLTRQLQDLGVLRPAESADDDLTFKVLFRNIWADNADVVSKSYSGTGALKTDFTRTGERTRAGMVQDLNNSITRYVKNNFGDGPRQDAFDLFLGIHLPSTDSIGSNRIFVDRRPTLIQSIPYVLAASIFLVLVASLARPEPDGTAWTLRLFSMLWLVVGGWCMHFIYNHGMLYVNWPKLNTPRWATEGYQEVLGSVRKDKLLGPLVNRHERGLSNARLGHMEEGKKRIQPFPVFGMMKTPDISVEGIMDPCQADLEKKALAGTTGRAPIVWNLTGLAGQANTGSVCHSASFVTPIQLLKRRRHSVAFTSSPSPVITYSIRDSIPHSRQPSNPHGAMPEQDSQRNALPEGIFSLLDTDLYKLTMQSAILKYLPEAHVTYAFTNRTPHMRLTREAYQWLQQQIKKLANIVVSPEEIQFLRKTCPYLSPSYLRFLSSFRLRPSQQVRTTFRPLNDTGGAEDVGDLHMDLEGRWLDTILYEVPLLALTSEAYFRFCDRDWDHKDQEEMAYDKGTKLMANGCIFSEFGSRRRRDYHTQDLVLRGLKRAHDEVPQRGWQGKLSGTSNVHFAMKYGILPVGTVAHEWFMGIASITNDYTHANEAALRYWVGCFGEGVLGIALTDTFGTPVFLKAFSRTMPTPEDAERDAVMTQIPGATGAPVSPPDSPDREERGPDYVTSKGRSYAQIFQGVRQDSGNPLEFVKLMKDFYHSQGITEKKTIVFSDSLNVERCLEYKKVAEEAGFAPSFGVGTFLTNDFLHLSDGTKSAPLNIVIKISSAGGRPAVKISDNVGKNTGDSETVHKVKETLGYVEKTWAQGDEKTRWGTDRSEASTVTNQEK